MKSGKITEPWINGFSNPAPERQLVPQVIGIRFVAVHWIENAVILTIYIVIGCIRSPDSDKNCLTCIPSCCIRNEKKCLFHSHNFITDLNIVVFWGSMTWWWHHGNMWRSNIYAYMFISQKCAWCFYKCCVGYVIYICWFLLCFNGTRTFVAKCAKQALKSRLDILRSIRFYILIWNSYRYYRHLWNSQFVLSVLVHVKLKVKFVRIS